MIIKVKKHIVPLYNNKRCNPYGVIEITDNQKTYIRKYDLGINNKYIINNKKYELIFIGSLYKPAFELKES